MFDRSPSFFSGKPDFSIKMNVAKGTKRLAATEQGDGVEVQKRPLTASTHTRKYNSNWQKEFSWLKLDAEQNKMYCSFCKEAGTKSPAKRTLSMVEHHLKRKPCPSMEQAIVTSVHETM